MLPQSDKLAAACLALDQAALLTIAACDQVAAEVRVTRLATRFLSLNDAFQLPLLYALIAALTALI